MKLVKRFAYLLAKVGNNNNNNNNFLVLWILRLF